MSIHENLPLIRRRITDACSRAERKTDEITLLGVSKGHTPALINDASEAGLTLFGESKIQELVRKINLCPSHLQWDFIGHLQTNKCRDAALYSRLIHSVDSERLALSLNDACGKLSIIQPVLLQVNVSGESSKYGFAPDEVLKKISQLNDLERLEIHGFMTMPPWGQEPEQARHHFRHLREIRNRAEKRLGAPLPHLSMGMSYDFEIAIEEGATLIRLGTVLFGKRSLNPKFR